MDLAIITFLVLAVVGLVLATRAENVKETKETKEQIGWLARDGWCDVGDGRSLSIESSLLLIDAILDA